jgi:hypothetical protein
VRASTASAACSPSLQYLATSYCLTHHTQPSHAYYWTRVNIHLSSYVVCNMYIHIQHTIIDTIIHTYTHLYTIYWLTTSISNDAYIFYNIYIHTPLRWLNIHLSSYVTCITIIDTIILTNYTNDAYIFDIYTSQVRTLPMREAIAAPRWPSHTQSGKTLHLI